MEDKIAREERTSLAINSPGVFALAFSHAQEPKSSAVDAVPHQFAVPSLASGPQCYSAVEGKRQGRFPPASGKVIHLSRAEALVGCIDLQKFKDALQRAFPEFSEKCVTFAKPQAD